MARPQLHSGDAILDAAQAVALESGVAAATISEIARVSGAPVGSIYHRFGSRDELLARLWLRAVRRSQALFLEAVEGPDPLEAAVSGALAVLDFCRDEPAEARLLMSYRREDFLRQSPSPELARELNGLNRRVEEAITELARGLHGRLSRAATERMAFVVFDLPYGAARRHLIAGGKPPAELRAAVETAARAVLADSSAGILPAL